MVLNDPTKALDLRVIGRAGYKGVGEHFDKNFEDVGFPIANLTFDTVNVLIFDVRGLYNFFIQLDNRAGTVAVDYKIDFATITTDSPETIPANTLFPLVTEQSIPAGAWSNATEVSNVNISEFIRATSKMTFIIISLKLAASGDPHVVKGVFSAV